MAVPVPFTAFVGIVKGNDIPLDFQIKKSGMPVDITGYSIWCAGKFNEADPDAAAIFMQTLTNTGIVLGDATMGTGQAIIFGSFTAALAAGTVFYWELQVKSPANHVSTVHKGSIALIERLIQDS